ncbi:MAG TPA: YfhO family protein [Gemmatimonadaceae bacterium]|nr:YfhO family protein [Gemmatimonadaceae bacterium]
MSPTDPRHRDTVAAPPAPRLAGLWVTLVYALATLALGYPALGGGFLVNPMSDQYGGFAYREFAATMLQEGHGFPQWNPYILGGLPYMAAQHGDIFYPTFILRALIPPDAAMTWGFLIHLFLAGLFTYGFLRAWQFRFYPALTGGLAYMLSGQVASLVSPGHDGKMYVSALAPLLLWMIVRAVRDGKVWAYAVIALATGLSVLSPHYQMTYYLGVLAGGFTLWLAFRGEPRLDRRAVILRLAGALGAAALGMALGAVQFAPFFEYLPYASRGVERGWEYATSYSHPPEELLNAYLPQFTGYLEHYSGRNLIKLHSDYLGATVLMLAGAAFGSASRRRLVWFWSIAGVLVLLVALGGHTPFYRLWYQLPMMSVVRAPSMIYYLLSLTAAVLSAVGLERILAGEKHRRYFLGWIAFGVLMALLASSGALTSLAETFADPRLAGVPAENRANLIVGAWRSLLFVALLAGAIILWDAGKFPMRALVIAVPLLVGADLWSVARAYFRFSPPAEELYASDPALDYLRARSDSGRVVALPISGDGMAHRDPLLGGDALMIHRIRATTGHQGNELQRWVELAQNKSPAPPQTLGSPQWRRLTNTRYWLTNAPLPEVIPELNARLALRVGPVTNALGSTAYVYEFLEDNPPAWVTPAYVEAPPDAVYNTVLDPRFDIGRAALFDSSEKVTGAQLSALPEPTGIVAAVERPHHEQIVVRLGAPAPAGSALVVSENWYPGWTATIDGSAAPVARADYSFIGVPLPEGAREIRLSFEEPAYAMGKAITLAALAVCVLIVVAGVVTERRRRA